MVKNGGEADGGRGTRGRRDGELAVAPDLGWVVESVEKSPAELPNMLLWLGEVAGRDHGDGAVTALLGCARTERGGRGREEQGGARVCAGIGEDLSTCGVL